jgi:ribonucleoside-diphosphate reductase alpha chain
MEEIVKIDLKDFCEEEITELKYSENYTYDIEVEDNHHYILDNGIVSHNSISFAAETSGGIEPVFALAYKRKIEKITNKFEEVFITDPVFEEYLNKNYPEKKEKILENVVENKGSCQKSKILSEEEKKIFITARDLTPLEHLDILEATAKNTSLSVSKTINVPKESTPEDISKVFLEAHKRGIIGVTVYREGSREGILIDINEDGRTYDKILKTQAPKRPKDLPCKVAQYTLKKQRYYVVIGLFSEEPYEIFTGINHDDDGNIYIPNNIEKGFIQKEKRGHYNLVTEEKTYVLTNGHSDANAEALTRMISTSLRHGTPVEYVCQQLEKVKGDMNTFAKVLIRALKTYIKDGTKVTGEVCLICGSSDLIRMEGCIKCKCGWSKCT